MSHVKNKFSSPGVVCGGNIHPLFCWNHPYGLFCFFRTFGDCFTVKIFAVDDKVCGAIQSLFNHQSVSLANGGWLVFQKLIPLIVKNDGEIIFDVADGLF